MHLAVAVGSPTCGILSQPRNVTVIKVEGIALMYAQAKVEHLGASKSGFPPRSKAQGQIPLDVIVLFTRIVLKASVALLFLEVIRAKENLPPPLAILDYIMGTASPLVQPRIFGLSRLRSS